MSGGPVEPVGGLGELWSKRVEAYAGRGRAQSPVVSLRQNAVSTPQGVVQSVRADGALHVAPEHLQP